MHVGALFPSTQHLLVAILLLLVSQVTVVYVCVYIISYSSKANCAGELCKTMLEPVCQTILGTR